MKTGIRTKRILAVVMSFAMIFTQVPQIGMISWAATGEENMTPSSSYQYHGRYGNDADHSCIGLRIKKADPARYGGVNAFDLVLQYTHKGNNIMTSYDHRGYGSVAKIGSSVTNGTALDVKKSNNIGKNVSVSMTFTGMPDVNIIRVGYVIENNGTSAQTVSVGGTVDTDIAGDDRAKIEYYDSGSSVGLISTAKGGEYLSFSTDGDFWYGQWTRTQAENSFAQYVQKAAGMKGKDGKLNSKDGTYDSCMSWIWQNVSVPAGSSVTKYCYFGVGDLTAGDDPYVIKTAASSVTVTWDANAGTDKVQGLPETGFTEATTDDPDVKLPTPSRDGYVFEGWYDQAAGGNKVGDGGDTYTSTERTRLYAHWKAIVSTVNVNLKMGSDAYTDQSVQLYQNGLVKFNLVEMLDGETTGNGTGTYSTGGVPNGTYSVGVNGADTGDKVVVSATTVESTWTKTVTVTLKQARITTTLDGSPSNVPGVVTLRQNDRIVYTLRSKAGEEGIWKTGVIMGTNASYDIYVGGLDTGKDITAGTLEQTIGFSTVKVSITDSEPWTTASVTLRDSNGEAHAVLPYAGADENVTTYQAILQDGDTEYSVDIGGIDTGKKITIGTENTADITFYTATVNVSCSKASDLPLAMTMSGDGRSYAFKKGTASNGQVAYTVEHVLSGTDYVLHTTGVSREGITVEVSITDDAQTCYLTVNVVGFMKYSLNSDGETFSASDSGTREYVISGGTVKAIESELDGFTFDGWAESAWSRTEAGYNAFDFTSEINADKTLYPHFLPSSVKINEVIRTNAEGEEITDGTDSAYRLGNLVITGFDQSNESIRYAIFNGTHIAKIEAKDLPSGATFDPVSGILEFSPLVSMETAQQTIRDCMIITPTRNGAVNEDGSITVTVMDKHGTIAESRSGDPAADTTGAKKVKSSTKTLSSGFWYVDANTTCAYDSNNKNGLTVSGTVYLYIAKDCTLTVTGRPANGTTGGGAAIKVSSGNTLYVFGEGTIKATGGAAASGSAGSKGSNSSFSGDDTVNLAAGGSGGAGGGGAGAGIGTDGGNGGAGGNGGQGWSVDKDHPTKKTNPDRGYNQGYNGSNGSSGTAGGNAGTVYITGTITRNVNGGSVGSSSGAGGGAGSSGCTDKGGHDRCYAGGAGGGGGGAGYAGASIGAGGNGGSGGGGGASAGYCWGYCYIGGGAGGGGAGGKNGSPGTDGKKGISQNERNAGIYDSGSSASGTSGGTGAKGHLTNSDGDWDDGFGGNGGNGGAKAGNGSNGTSNTNYTGTIDPAFSITYSKGNSSDTIGTDRTESYVFGTETQFALPEYVVNDPASKFFLGWWLKTYGVELGSVSNNPLATDTGDLYPAGHEFMTTETTAGNLGFVAVLGQRAGLYAHDTIDYTATKMKTYKVTTLVDGEPCDVGTVRFGDTEVRGLNGEYVYSTPANSVTVYSGDKDIAEMEVTGDELTAEATADFESVKVTVKGYKPSDVTLVDGPVMAMVSENDTAKTYVYGSQYRPVDEEKGEYVVNVDGGSVNKIASYGSETTVNYHTLTIKVSPSTARNVILKDAEGNLLITEKVGSGESDTFTYTALEDTETTYDIYADGTLTGATGVTFGETRTITADYYVTSVTVTLDGAKTDIIGVPRFGSRVMTKKEPGVYICTSADGTAQTVTMSGETVIESMEAGAEETLPYVSVVYEKNTDDEGHDIETGEVPDPTYVLTGSNGSYLSVCTLKNGVQKFSGWNINGRIYSLGEKVYVDELTSAKPVWNRIDLNGFTDEGRSATVIFDQEIFGYDGTSRTPVIEVYWGDDLLTEDTDYTVTFETNSNPDEGAGDVTVRAGVVTVMVQGTGDYAGVLYKDYEILPKLIHVTFDGDLTATYNGGTNVTLNESNARLETVADADKSGTAANPSRIKIRSGTLKGDLDDPNVETGKPIRLDIENTKLDGTSASNYAVTHIEGTKVNVLPKEISITGIGVYDKAYDGTADATVKPGSAVFSGIAEGDAEALSAALSDEGSAAFDSASVGENKHAIVTGFVLTGSAAGNYILTNPTASLSATANIIKASQSAPALGEGYSLSKGADGNVTVSISSDRNTDSYGNITDTNYEIMWVKKDAGEEEQNKTGRISKGESFIEDENCDYYIRWTSDDNHDASGYTKVITDVMAGKSLASLPVAIEGLVFDGSEQIGVKEGKGYTITENTAVNSGKYTAVAKLKDGYVWPDGTTVAKQISWTISRKSQAAPVAYADEDASAIAFVCEPGKTIEYSEDGGKTWRTLISVSDEPLEGEETVPGSFTGYMDEPEYGKTYLFRYKETDQELASPATPVKWNVVDPISKGVVADIEADSATLIWTPSSDNDYIIGNVVFAYREKGETSWRYATAVLNDGRYTFSVDELSEDTLYEFVTKVTYTNSASVESEPATFRTIPAEIPEDGTGAISVSIGTESAEMIKAVVTVEQGNDIINSQSKSVTEGAPVDVSFTGLPVGHYNVVLYAGDYRETRMIDVYANKVETALFTIPKGKLATVVEIDESDVGVETPKVAVEGLNDIVTEKDKDNAAEGRADVEVRFVAKEKGKSAPGAAELKQMAGKDEIKSFVDMTLYKTTTVLDVDGKPVSIDVQDIGLDNTKVLEIAIPYDTRSGTIVMYRYHNGNKEKLTSLTGRANAGNLRDGTFFADRSAGYIFLYASGFSTYAIGYQSTGAEQTNGTGDTGRTGSARHSDGGLSFVVREVGPVGGNDPVGVIKDLGSLFGNNGWTAEPEPVSNGIVDEVVSGVANGPAGEIEPSVTGTDSILKTGASDAGDRIKALTGASEAVYGGTRGLAPGDTVTAGTADPVMTGTGVVDTDSAVATDVGEAEELAVVDQTGQETTTSCIWHYLTMLALILAGGYEVLRRRRLGNRSIAGASAIAIAVAVAGMIFGNCEWDLITGIISAIAVPGLGLFLKGRNEDVLSEK